MKTFYGVRPLRGLHLVMILLVCFASTSCAKKGRPLYPIHGRVMFDGKPLEGVIVILHPLEDVELGDAKPRARTDADGSFKVYTFMTDDGAPAGAYDVSILPKKPKQEGGTARSKGAKRQAKANERAAEAAAGKPTTKKAKSDKTPNPAKHQEKKMEIEALVPVRYRNKETSGLRIQVKEGINNLEPFLLEK